MYQEPFIEVIALEAASTLCQSGGQLVAYVTIPAGEYTNLHITCGLDSDYHSVEIRPAEDRALRVLSVTVGLK